jgi:hypothetical protein
MTGETDERMGESAGLNKRHLAVNELGESSI